LHNCLKTRVSFYVLEIRSRLCTKHKCIFFAGGPPRPGMLPAPPMGGPPMMPMMGPPPHGMMPGGPGKIGDHLNQM